MILTFITGSLTLAALTFVIALVQVGFLFTFGIVFVTLAAVLSFAFALTTWAIGRRLPHG